jgi:hypothetical protein
MDYFADFDDSPALTDWKRQKDADLSEKDSEDEELAKKLRGEAQTRVEEYFQTLRTEQDKRSKANAEAEATKVGKLEEEGRNPWEKVGQLLDFTRTNSHEKDITKFRRLLIELKNPRAA